MELHISYHGVGLVLLDYSSLKIAGAGLIVV